MTERSVSIKQINPDRVRAFMDQEGSVSKSRISRRLRLSFPTVTRLVDELCSAGEFLEQGTGTSTGGRCACFHELDPHLHLYLLVQIEDGWVCWNVRDMREETVNHSEFCLRSFSLERLDSLIRSAIQRYRRLSAVSIGVAALVGHGTVEESTVLDCLKGMNLPEHLKDVTCLPVVFESDMNYPTMGCWTGEQASVNSLIILFLNKRGMGGDTIIDNRLRTGASGFCTRPCFLPFMDRYWEGLDKQPAVMDATELYTRLIQVYACTVNPSMVVLYHNPFLEGRLDGIRSRCAACLPARALSSIELSKGYQKDYEWGLLAMARSVS